MKRNNVSEKNDTFAFCHRPLAVHLSVKQKGFTLIEVMVAAVILFSVIASVSMIYRGAFISSEKANNHVEIAGVLPSILASLRYDIRQQGNSASTELSQQGSTWNVNYHWQAKLIDFKSAPEKFDVDTGKFITPPKKYKLWQVVLTLESNGLKKQYQLKELSWSDA